MKSVLNLSPQERRLVVGVLVVVFVFLNFWLVWPHFNDWRTVQDGISEAERKLYDYTSEAALRTQLQQRADTLEDINVSLPLTDQGLYFDRAIRKMARESNLMLQSVSQRTSSFAGSSTASRARDFFEEREATLSIQADDQQLVSFLHALGASNSFIRVKQMSLRPEAPAKTKIQGELILVASFPRDESAPANPK
jgi:hypothetical protein